MLVFQHLRAPNDTNGNPRRVFAIYEIVDEGRYERSWATIHAVVDEGYSGTRAIEQAGFGPVRAMVELPSIDITPKEYRELRTRPSTVAQVEARAK